MTEQEYKKKKERLDENVSNHKSTFEENLKIVEESQKIIDSKKAIDPTQMSIEGNVQWKLNINLAKNETLILCNQSVSNEAATLALANNIITNIIEDKQKKGIGSKDTQRLRITQFELQKLFAQCITYIIDNKDKELIVKENKTV